MQIRWLVSLVVFATAVLGHECERPCVVGDTRTCVYEFHLQEYHTLSRACYECPDVIEDCSRPECIAVDGVFRTMVSVNRQMPGPSIQVCEGDRVIVDVYSSYLSDVETIHWHGQHMKDFQYYDGVPFTTQCPIMGAFRYDFVPTNPGTTFWHSHAGLHRSDAVYGALIVRQAEDQHAQTYDVDDFAHVLIVQDWVHEPIFNKFIGLIHGKVPGRPDTLLVNGKGRNTKAGIEGVPLLPMPLEVVTVTSNLRYRLRLIYAGGLNCPVAVSVDGHRLTVISADAQNIIPVTVDSVVMYSGERFDVVIETNQPVDNYWIRFNGLMDCGAFEIIQGVILRYDGAPEVEPDEDLTYSPDYQPGIVLNPFNSPGGENQLTMVDLSSFDSYTLSENVDKQFYVALDFKGVNNTRMYNIDYYPYNQVSDEWKYNSPQVNGVTFQFPNSPLLSQPDTSQSNICLYDEDVSQYCVSGFCSCTYVMEVALGETVEFVLIDEGISGLSNHPFHLHGYSFSVVSMGKLGNRTSAAVVAAADAAGLISRKLESPVLKDTVIMPDGGYTIVRFTADNPGYWLMHCHLIFHSEAGMAALLHVGDQSDLPPVPAGFPTCQAFLPPLPAN